MTAWTVPYAQRSMKTVSGFSPSSFLAASMTGSITNILLNAMFACVRVCVCVLRYCGGKEKSNAMCWNLLSEGLFRSCKKFAMTETRVYQSMDSTKDRGQNYYTRNGGRLAVFLPRVQLPSRSRRQEGRAALIMNSARRFLRECSAPKY